MTEPEDELVPKCTAQRQVIKLARCLADEAIVVVLPGLAYPVIITAGVIKIGCETHPASEWEAFTDEQITAISDNILPIWQRFKGIIITLAGT